jgi:hypothetical protein
VIVLLSLLFFLLPPWLVHTIDDLHLSLKPPFLRLLGFHPFRRRLYLFCPKNRVLVLLDILLKGRFLDVNDFSVSRPLLLLLMRDNRDSGLDGGSGYFFGINGGG